MGQISTTSLLATDMIDTKVGLRNLIFLLDEVGHLKKIIKASNRLH